MINGRWNTPEVLCAHLGTDLYVPTGCEYLLTVPCEESGCPQGTYNLASGEFAIVSPSGQILDPTVPIANEFAFAIGGNGFTFKTKTLSKKMLKSITSTCPTDGQVQKTQILFSNIQCATDYSLGFTIHSPIANIGRVGGNLMYSRVRTGCCENCDTTGNAVALARMFAHDINSGNFCGGLKNRFIKATVICTPTDVWEVNPAVCNLPTCPDCEACAADPGLDQCKKDGTCIKKTYEAGLIIEGLTYPEYCGACCIPVDKKDLGEFKGTTFYVKYEGLSSSNNSGWNCNINIQKIQSLVYPTGDGCKMIRLERESNRNYIDPLSGNMNFYDYPLESQSFGQYSCECGKKYCIFELVFEQPLAYDPGHNDLHVYLGIDNSNEALSDAIATFLNTQFGFTGLTCDCPVTPACGVGTNTVVAITGYYGEDNE